MLDDKIRVLIVEDEPEVANVLNEAATGFGHRTAVALNGAHALRAVRELAPHVVLLDIRMPGMDGLRCSSAGLNPLSIIGALFHAVVGLVAMLFVSLAGLVSFIWLVKTIWYAV